MSNAASMLSTAKDIEGKVGQTAGRVQELGCKVEQLCGENRTEPWRALKTARAIVLSARARIIGQDTADNARKLLHEALLYEPSLVDAYDELADLHIRYKEDLDVDWASKSKSWLDRAMELNPGCRRTKELLKKLEASHEPDRKSKGAAV